MVGRDACYRASTVVANAIADLLRGRIDAQLREPAFCVDHPELSGTDRHRLLEARPGTTTARPTGARIPTPLLQPRLPPVTSIETVVIYY